MDRRKEPSAVPSREGISLGVRGQDAKVRQGQPSYLRLFEEAASSMIEIKKDIKYVC
jgi:hypothetical protein